MEGLIRCLFTLMVMGFTIKRRRKRRKDKGGGKEQTK